MALANAKLAGRIKREAIVYLFELFKILIESARHNQCNSVSFILSQ